jgi:hypothetical protein
VRKRRGLGRMMWLVAIRMEEAGVWKDWKDVKPVCVELTVLLGRRLNCKVRERVLSDLLFMVMTRQVD